MNRMPPIVAVVGKKKSGKTTVLVKIAAELSARGWRVATLKHSHGFTMDHEGRDTWRHRQEGKAIRTVIAAENDFAVLGSWPGDAPLDALQLVERFLSDADIVLVEGYHTDRFPTIEVFQAARHAQLWYSRDTAHRYLAIAADTEIDADCPVYDLSDPNLTNHLVDLLEAGILHARPIRS